MGLERSSNSGYFAYGPPYLFAQNIRKIGLRSGLVGAEMKKSCLMGMEAAKYS
jgi:hypothetical protein